MARKSEKSRKAVKFGEVHIVSGKPYRTGFLNAFWGNFDLNDPRTLLRARRENFLSNLQDVYHYTSLSGLKGIVEENGFWASDNRFMNDAQETSNGIRLARYVLQHKARRSSDPAFASILRNVDELIAAPREYGHLVACFSEARDDLGQWRGYASGGVCLRLGKSAEGETPLFFAPEQMLHKVRYDDRQKCVLLLSVTRSFEREYALDRRTMKSKWPDDHDKNYTEHIHSKISAGILGFKDASFRNESEARIVLSYQDLDRFEGGLRFRASPLGIIPYVRTGDDHHVKEHGGRLPLREVIVGPAPHQELIAESVKTFLRQCSYVDTHVTLSKVPYRSP